MFKRQIRVKRVRSWTTKEVRRRIKIKVFNICSGKKGVDSINWGIAIHKQQLSFISAVSAGAPTEKFFYDEQDIREHGLGIITATIFLAGEMAGTGVLALPAAMKGTGYYGLLFIIVFTINACFSGTRLGTCWVILEERYPEFKGIIRDPYPTIGERAIGKWGRQVQT